MGDQTDTNPSFQTMTVEQLLARLKEDNHPWLPAIGIFEDDQMFAE